MRPRRPGSEIAPGLEVLEHIARSNVLDVYDAWSYERGARVVAKTLRPDKRADRRAVAALLREGRLLRRFAHPHLVRGYDVLSEPHPTIVLETLGGETLAHLIARSDRGLPVVDLGYLGLHLVSAVGYLHAQGVLHLDLKPSNVVAENGRAKVIDLSLARKPGRVRPGTGTWSYLSPEQARGDRVGPEADVWGIGVLLREAAVAENVFDDERDGDVEYPQLHRRAEPARRERPRLPRPLADTIDAALAPDPGERPTLHEMAAAFAGVAGADVEARLGR
jgi:eukaryotic-like serine/threonine-protein kinase